MLVIAARIQRRYVIKLPSLAIISLWSLVQIQPLPAFISEDWNQGLASGTEAGAAVLYRDPLDGAAASGAEFASSMSNLKIRMCCAQFALGADIGVHAGAFAADGCPENSADIVM